jgi:hypothetical protein
MNLFLFHEEESFFHLLQVIIFDVHIRIWLDISNWTRSFYNSWNWFPRLLWFRNLRLVKLDDQWFVLGPLEFSKYYLIIFSTISLLLQDFEIDVHFHDEGVLLGWSTYHWILWNLQKRMEYHTHWSLRLLHVAGFKQWILKCKESALFPEEA